MARQRGKIFGEKIRHLRDEHDLTQSALADKAGVSIMQIKNIEIGRNGTTKEVASAIATALQVPLDEIYIEDFRNTTIITLSNSKGGVGKTSSVLGLAHALSRLDGNKVLIVEADMQRNLSFGLGIQENTERSLYAALMREDNFSEYIQPTGTDSLDIIIADYSLATVDFELSRKQYQETIFQRGMSEILEKGMYDYVVVDTSPNLGLLNFNILSVSDYVIVPVELSAYGLQGLDTIFRYISKIKEVNHKLEILGVLKTKVDRREAVTDTADKTLESVFDNVRIFDSYISIDTNVKKAQWSREHISDFDPRSRAAKQYMALAKEVVKYGR